MSITLTSHRQLFASTSLRDCNIIAEPDRQQFFKGNHEKVAPSERIKSQVYQFLPKKLRKSDINTAELVIRKTTIKEITLYAIDITRQRDYNFLSISVELST